MFFVFEEEEPLLSLVFENRARRPKKLVFLGTSLGEVGESMEWDGRWE